MLPSRANSAACDALSPSRSIMLTPVKAWSSAALPSSADPASFDSEWAQREQHIRDQIASARVRLAVSFPYSFPQIFSLGLTLIASTSFQPKLYLKKKLRQTVTNIVLVHAAWADGSSWSNCEIS
jgi:hypothetical protein